MTPARRALALGGLAVLLGGLAASDVHEREVALRRSVGPLVPVLVAAAPIPQGAPIARARLAVRRVPERFAPRGAFRQAIEVEGARAGVRIARGTDLTPSLLAAPVTDHAASPGLRPAERVARILAVGSSTELRPGTRADVLVSRPGSAVTRVLLGGATVLDARPARAPAGADGPVAELPHVVLALRVTLRQAVLLAQAQNDAGELRALARP